MKQKQTALLASAFAALLPASAWSFGGWAGGIGKNFSRAATRAGVERIAVLPFSPLDGSDSREGEIIAEEVTFDIARRGRIRLVERAMLNTVLNEHRMGFTGALDRSSLARLGRLLQAKAVVTGTFITHGNRVEVYARLIDIETGTIIAAHSTERKRSFFPLIRTAIPEARSIDPMEAIMEVKLFQEGNENLRPEIAMLPGLRATQNAPLRRSRTRAEDDLRDSVGHDACQGMHERIDELENRVMTLKVRYWADQIRKHKLSLSETSRRLTKTMGDRSLKTMFPMLLKDAVLHGSAPLNPIEVKKFVAADSEAFVLRLRCKGGSQ